jgi:hypothetical protein
MPAVKTKPETRTAAAPTAAAAAAAPPVTDPSALLARRKQERQAAAWNEARKLVTQPSLTEGDVIRLADLLEQAGLQAEWIGPLRAALALRTEAENTRDERVKGAGAESLADLGRLTRAARDAFAQRQEAVRRQIAELERELQVIGGTASPQSQELARLGSAEASAAAAQQLAEQLAGWFRPLFDPAATVSDFGLPAIADSLPLGIANALRAAGLVGENGGLTALVAPPAPPPPPRAQPTPVLRCGVGPSMQREERPPRSLEMRLNGVVVDRVP